VPGLDILALAVALAMDALAVALATGVALKRVSRRQTFRLAWHFGLFQALMPIIGWALGLSVRSAIERFDHWIAFALLAFIGAKMIREAFALTEEAERADPTRGWSLVMLSVATSIDALAVGLSMSMLGLSIWTPAAVIGLVCLLFTAAGLHLGRFVGNAARLSFAAEILGGVVLIAIGLNILRDHGVFSGF
jgi:putative Mn2+ efflux pump MntP